MIKRLLLAFFIAIFTIPAFARPHPWDLTQADKTAIRQVIRAQLAAFRKDDADLAFSYASPLLQDKFGNAENFLDMVKTAYPSVYRPRDVQFRELETTTDGPVQKVFFFGPDGDPVLGLYLMQKQRNGKWKTNGCELAPAPDRAI